MVVVPASRAVTTPVVDTVATAGLPLNQLIVGLDGFDGDTVAVRVSVASMVAVDLFKEMPVTGTTVTGTLVLPAPQSFLGLTHTWYGVPLNRSVSVTAVAVTVWAGVAGIALVVLL
jgi:hypothetical protein